jgi:hypothetical protein
MNHLPTPVRLFLGGVLLLGVIAAPWAAGAGNPVEWPVASGGNGHFYQLVEPSASLTWEAANQTAQAMTHGDKTGHLATITSQAEQDFIMSLGLTVDQYWLGGLQRGSRATDGGWRWVVRNEKWGFTAWAPGEPNNGSGVEDRLEFISVNGTWNDVLGTAPRPGFIVEYE